MSNIEVSIVNIKEMRNITGLSQSKFASLFDIPVSTLKDWEIGRRTPPNYVINMMQTILQNRGMLADPIQAMEERRLSVQRCIAILLTATEGPNELFMDALEKYIDGSLSLAELEQRVDHLEYIGV